MVSTVHKSVPPSSDSYSKPYSALQRPEKQRRKGLKVVVARTAVAAMEPHHSQLSGQAS